MEAVPKVTVLRVDDVAVARGVKVSRKMMLPVACVVVARVAVRLPVP
jgi:hypothetical protein